MFISITLTLIFMSVLPTVFGAVVVSLLGGDKGVINCYATGFLSLMALCELIAVPCALFKASFTLVIILFFLAIAGIIALGLIKKSIVQAINIGKLKQIKKTYGIAEYITLAAMVILWGLIIFNSLRMYVIDQDDSRFVVTAADMIRTNTLFLSDPNTGVVYDTWSYGIDVSKDLVAPHAVFCAILSRVTLSEVTLFMHSFYPVFLYILALSIYYNIASELMEGSELLKTVTHKVAYKYLFLTLIALFCIFQYSTRNTREAVFLVRLWQGKAILAGIIIPALFLILYRIYRTSKRDDFCLLYIASLAGCLTSSMATLIIPFMIGIYGLVYGFAKKSLKTTIVVWGSAVVPILLALLSLYIRNELLLCL